MVVEKVDRKPLNWPTILFIVGTTAGAVLWPAYAYFYGVTLAQVLLAVAYFVTAGMSITVGYHRLISHRSFNCHPWMKASLLVTGSTAWQGSALDWAADHIRHHGFTDTEKDPYNIKQGIWHAHVGWLFRRRTTERSVPGFLTSDPLVVWQDRHYIPLAIFTSFVVPYLIAGTGGLLLAGVVRIVIGHHVTWLVNSWAHTGGSRPYNPGCSAADNWVVALVTFGEGWHNYHHTFPQDYRSGITAWSWDPSKWLIRSLSYCGIAYDLKWVGPVLRWQRRAQSAIANATEDSRHAGRLRATRTSLEAQLENTRVRLEQIIESGSDFEINARGNLHELREGLTRALHENAARVGASSRKKMERARELLDRMEAYGDLLERMRECEADLAPA